MISAGFGGTFHSLLHLTILHFFSDRQVDSRQEYLVRDQAAKLIQGFWRRHRRRKLAAQAALRRMMAEQKRRLDDTVRSQGMPLRAVQARQKQMNEKRVLEEHRKKIMVGMGKLRLLIIVVINSFELKCTK